MLRCYNTARRLLLSRTASANPPEQCATFARSINLSRDFPQATLDRGDAFGTVHSNKASRHSARPLTIATPHSRRI